MRALGACMPFQKERYPENWKKISLTIRNRENWQCKWCGAKNGKPHPVTGSKVILTVAHLGTVHADGTPGDKHDKMDVRPENLAALCQRCHLNFDRDEHAANAAKTRRRRKIEAGQMVLPLPRT
jgi:5-methylcytosine-specific restriction endonuclease McrA